MEIKGSMAHPLDSSAEFLKCAGLIAEGNGNLDAFAKIESLQRRLPREIGIGVAIIRGNAAQIAAKRRYGQIIPYIQRRKLFRQIAVIRVRQRPLREIIRESFGQKMVASQCLKSMMKDRSVTAMFQPCQEFADRACRLTAEAHQ